MPDRPPAPFESSSAFRFVSDGTTTRDVADASAVAQELAALIRAVTEQPFWLPAGAPEAAAADPASPGVGSGGADPAPAGADLAASAVRGLGLEAPGEDIGPDELWSRSPTASVLLAQPAAVAGRERAEQGCQALDNSWYREAADLFLEGTRQTPTEPALWFGAGLAASRHDPSLAADHLARASRYLLAGDPAGSAYAAIVAAALHESTGDAPAARRLLQRCRDELDQPCPAISLHLARLGGGRRGHLADALLVDPLLEADVRALRLDPGGEVAAVRRARTELEIRRLDESIAALRDVGAGQPIRPGDSPGAGSVRPPEPGQFPLIQLEFRLWRKLEASQQEIEHAGRAVDHCQQARRAIEDDLGATARLAMTDLAQRTTIPFFLFSLGAALAVVVTFAGSRLLAEAAPVIGPLAGAVAWLSRALVVVLTARQFVRVWWPHRRYSEARRAKMRIPHLEWEVSQLRSTEFEARRRYDRARQDAELRMRRIVDRRQALVTRRPRFISPERPPPAPPNSTV
jgi:hypothetical protein